MDDLKYHFCDRDEGWMEYDARGIALTFVCEKCRKAKLSEYRPEVLQDPQYQADESIEPDLPLEEYYRYGN